MIGSWILMIPYGLNLQRVLQHTVAVANHEVSHEAAVEGQELAAVANLATTTIEVVRIDKDAHQTFKTKIFTCN